MRRLKEDYMRSKSINEIIDNLNRIIRSIYDREREERYNWISNWGIPCGFWISNTLYLWIDINIKINLRRISISKKISTLWTRSYNIILINNSNTFTQSIINNKISFWRSGFNLGKRPNKRIGKYCLFTIAFLRSSEKFVSPNFQSIRISYNFSSKTFSD